jgi:hypothetical protein
MPNHPVRSMQASLRGMPPDAPIMVRDDGAPRPLCLVGPAWVADGTEDSLDNTRCWSQALIAHPGALTAALAAQRRTGRAASCGSPVSCAVFPAPYLDNGPFCGRSALHQIGRRH